MAQREPSEPTESGSERVLRRTMLELRHLRLLLAIEQEGGITRAGERLFLTQSALSHQLKEIEARLGVPLFLRIKKRLHFTKAGRKVLAAARRVLPQVVQLEQELQAHAAGRRGVLRLTTECYTCYEWLPSVLERFAERYPGVDVRIVAEATERPLEALREGSVDLALVADPTDCDRYSALLAAGGSRDLDLQPLFEDEYLLAVPPDHPLAARDAVRA